MVIVHILYHQSSSVIQTIYCSLALNDDDDSDEFFTLDGVLCCDGNIEGDFQKVGDCMVVLMMMATTTGDLLLCVLHGEVSITQRSFAFFLLFGYYDHRMSNRQTVQKVVLCIYVLFRCRAKFPLCATFIQVHIAFDHR